MAQQPYQLNIADVVPELDGREGFYHQRYIASLSYGKDSLAMLHIIKDVLHLQLDEIYTADTWATDDLPADLPEMVEFKAYADEVIRSRWGITVKHVCARNKAGEKQTFERGFYNVRKQGPSTGKIYGWPLLRGSWCVRWLKTEGLAAMQKCFAGAVQYLGIAADETERVVRHGARPDIILPLVRAEWTEADCYKWCQENGLLSPIYTTSFRGGCWFCPKQGTAQLRNLYHTRPDLWQRMVELDRDSPYTFTTRRLTVQDYDARFRYEDAHGCPDVWRWDLIKGAE